jgi:hypothetical protein
MKKLVTIAATVAIAIALFGASHHVRAQGNQRPYGPPGANLPASTPAVLTAHTLITSYSDYGDDGTSGNGYQPVDGPFNTNCTSGTGCTIELESWVDVGGNTSGALVGICLFVDGVQAPDCPYIGALPSSGSYITTSSSQTVAVGPGTHVLQTLVYTTGTAGIAFYHNNYHLYRP